MDAEAILAERSANQLSIREVAQYVDELRDLLQDSELAQRKSLVKSCVREIVVIGGEAVMHYVLPLPGNAGQKLETFVADGGVLATVRSGGLARTRTGSRPTVNLAPVQRTCPARFPGNSSQSLPAKASSSTRLQGDYGVPQPDWLVEDEFEDS